MKWRRFHVAPVRPKFHLSEQPVAGASSCLFCNSYIVSFFVIPSDLSCLLKVRKECLYCPETTNSIWHKNIWTLLASIASMKCCRNVVIFLNGFGPVTSLVILLTHWNIVKLLVHVICQCCNTVSTSFGSVESRIILHTVVNTCIM